MYAQAKKEIIHCLDVIIFTRNSPTHLEFLFCLDPVLFCVQMSSSLSQ